MPHDPAELPRVLIVTANPLSETSNNGKTYASFFRGYPKEKLAQLYFHRDPPTSDVADKYFRMSDEDVAAYARGRTTGIGRPVSADAPLLRLVSADTNRRLRKSATLRLVRSLALRAILRTDKGPVDEWLTEFSPEVIFFCGGNANYLYDVARDLSARFDAPLVLYITDDYLLPSLAGGPAGWIGRAWTRREFRRTTAVTSLVLTIGTRMSEVYLDRFSVRSKPIMNLVPTRSAPPPESERDGTGDAVVLCYAGGLHSNRWRVLAQLGEAIDECGRLGLNAELRIFSQTELAESDMAKLVSSPSVRYLGAIPADQVNEALDAADILVHVEAFDQRSQAVTLLSVSTKIPEYLAAGRCVLAVGPANVASIRYLESTEAAAVATSAGPEELRRVLTPLIREPARRAGFAERAIAVAKQNHDEVEGRERLWRDLVQVVRAARADAADRAGMSGPADRRKATRKSRARHDRPGQSGTG